MDIPARSVLLGDLVENPDLPNAIALNYSVFTRPAWRGRPRRHPHRRGILVFSPQRSQLLPAHAALKSMRRQPARPDASAATGLFERPLNPSATCTGIEIRHAMLPVRLLLPGYFTSCSCLSSPPGAWRGRSAAGLPHEQRWRRGHRRFPVLASRDMGERLIGP